ncbi:hypothetical protein B7494_g7226 [Chlorociboria aeruginascens]|nr:hypothetical protein B7494_g7226 [Chlorociboria aeruginascens]
MTALINVVITIMKATLVGRSDEGGGELVGVLSGVMRMDLGEGGLQLKRRPESINTQAARKKVPKPGVAQGASDSGQARTSNSLLRRDLGSRKGTSSFHLKASHYWHGFKGDSEFVAQELFRLQNRLSRRITRYPRATAPRARSHAVEPEKNPHHHWFLASTVSLPARFERADMSATAMKKALPPRPSVDLDAYPPDEDRKYGLRRPGTHRSKSSITDLSYSRPGSRKGLGMMGANGPSPSTVLQGYKNDIVNGFEGEKPRYNPMNPTRPQSSTLLNVNDPIQVHLLVEIALGDSKEFEILSQEEVDDLKKQCQSITQRIEQTRQNLAIQSKYRDAAMSMSKLYSPSSRKKSVDTPEPGLKKKRSILGHSRTNSEKQAEDERMVSEKKCEELAAELWTLEKRLIEPQNRLLKHTAGILQMTHKGPKKNKTKGQGPMQPGGVPGSPESMYTYHNSRTSVEHKNEENLFDERSLYRSPDRLDRFDEWGAFGTIDSPVSPSAMQIKEHMKMIAHTEQKLEDLNNQLRQVIVKANPQREMAQPPLARTNRAGKPTDAGETLESHLDYLQATIGVLEKEHSWTVRKSQESEMAAEKAIEGINSEVQRLLLVSDPDRPIPPASGAGLKRHMAYFQESVDAIEIELARAENISSRSMGNQDNLEQIETVLMGLWDIIQSGEEEVRQRKLQRRMTRSANGVPDESDESDDDNSSPNESFTLQGFSTKVQWLYSQATRLKDQKKVLQRQIKQQRELNNKSDATKDAEIGQKAQEMTRLQSLLDRTESDADRVREQLSDTLEKLNEAREESRQREQARSGSESASIREAQEELTHRNRTIAALEAELEDLKDDRSIANAETQGKLAESESKIATITVQLAAATSAKESTEALVKEQEEQLTRKEKEMEEMNMDLARLQTEVTIARAELDGAYGSRAQRAAEVAANPAIQKEIDDLTKKNISLAAEISTLKSQTVSAGAGSKEQEAQMQTLKKELAETIEEYEQMTKASIEWEKEREMLEGSIDKLRDERENLEAQLSDEKVRWLGMKSPGIPGDGSGGNTSTTVLKNEFKKMMRDTRAENTRILRAEQAERRRVEEELRALKRAQGPGKSGLSQSSFAA